MFKNTIARTEIEKTRFQLKVLGKEKIRIQLLIKELRDKYDITDNRTRTRSKLVPSEIWDLRAEYVKQVKELDEKIEPIRKKWRDQNLQLDKEENVALRTVFAEIFGDQQREEIYKEVERRRNGEMPIPTGYDFKELQRYKDERYKYKQLAKEQIDTMIEFRVMLTGIIKEGCERFGDAEFLKFISPLNKLIIPVDELKKIKIKHLL